MDNTKERETILQSIKNGLRSARFKKFEPEVISNKEIYVTPDKPLIETFIEEITKINGECYYCQDQQELLNRLKEIHSTKNLEVCYTPDPKFIEIVKQAGVPYIEKFENPESIRSGISSCEFLIARFGSVMVSSALPGGRRIFSFPEIHIIIAEEKQLVLEIEEALAGIQQKYGDDLPSQIINITGPSRTADIEKTLILGAHGPKQLVVLILKSQ